MLKSTPRRMYAAAIIGSLAILAAACGDDSDDAEGAETVATDVEATDTGASEAEGSELEESATSDSGPEGTQPVAEESESTASTMAASECADEPYKIGSLASLTGQATFGIDSNQAVVTYVDRLNAAGGINGRVIELLVEDTASVPSQAVDKFRKLEAEGVVAIVGPAPSAESLAVKPIAEEAGVTVLTFSSSPAIVQPIEESRFMFKIFPDTGAGVRGQLEYLQSEGITTAAMMAENTAYGQDALDALTPELAAEHGVTIVATEVYDPVATDMTAQLRTIAEQSPEVLLLWGTNPGAATVASSADLIDFEPQILGSPGVANPQFIDLGGSAVEGVLVLGSWMLDPTGIEPSSPQYDYIQSFVEAWQEEFDMAPNGFNANGWDAMTMVENALRRGTVSSCDLEEARQQFLNALETETKEMALANAIFNFSPEEHGPGDSTAGLALLVVEDGKFIAKSYE